MLKKISDFFRSEFSELTDAHSQANALGEDRKRLACAALMIEVAIVDQNFDKNELASLESTLQTQFGLDHSTCQQLIELAQDECKQATSTYQFTQLVNTHCSDEDKFELIQNMWVIAYADGKIDKYEEHCIRKVAELIYLKHSDFILAKKRAVNSQGID